jgi:LuxR family transcriptional regulator, maltose regulon positive regulatory protein
VHFRRPGAAAQGTEVVAARDGGSTAALDWDGLLATKLHRPRLQPEYVRRQRLIDRLEESLASGLVLVSAPAGFGKTTLLADWADQSRAPVAWLSLDQGDNDPARFWRHVVAALDLARAGTADQLLPLIAPGRSFEGIATALINRLAGQPKQLRIVLDDYQFVDAEPVHAALTFLLEHRPPALRLVLASRADPPLPLARLRAHGQLAELRAADLRFTTEEAGALLRTAVDDDLPAGSVSALTARTEGWAAGLQLAALSLHGQSDVAGFVATFSGSQRYVLDFLAEEVLDRQPDQLRTFLLETSVLERLCGELCDAVTGRTDGQQTLEQVERANLFLTPLDAARRWWRYHQLFADLLRVRLQQQQHDRLAVLHRRAAVWSEAHGLADDAVRHALAAGDEAWAGRLVERHLDGLLLRSERVTLARWLAALPVELVESRARLLLGQTLFALVSGQVDVAAGPLDAAERAAALAVDEPYEPSVGRAASLVANVPATIALARAFQAELRGDPDAETTFGHRALAEIGDDERTLRAITRAHLGVAEWLRGSVREAERALTDSVPELHAAGQRFLAVRYCEHLSQVRRALGEPDGALACYQQALEIATPPDGTALPAAGIAHVGMAEVAYQRNQLDTALEHATRGIESCRQLVYTQPLATGLATLARIRLAAGDVAGAADAVHEARQCSPSPNVASLLNPVPALLARLELAQGNVTAASGWTRHRGLRPDDEPGYPREPEYLVLVRVLLAQDRPDQSLALLDRLRSCALAQDRAGSLLEIEVLRAVALAARRDRATALATLDATLTLGWRQGRIRVFADEGAPMRALLAHLIAARRAEQDVARDVPVEYLGLLVRAFQTDAPPALGLVESLSRRELEVLRLVAAGKPNQQIADELVVTRNTVKRHVTHILEKLGATNRTEASARARELGLVP